MPTGEDVQVRTTDPEVLGGDPYFIRGQGNGGDIGGLDVHHPNRREQNIGHGRHQVLLGE
jgi:hypothetical protein